MSKEAPTVNYQGEDMPLWKFYNFIKWEKLISKVDKVLNTVGKDNLEITVNNKEIIKLTSNQYKTCLALIIIGYNLENGDMKSTFEKTRKDPNDIVADDYFLFAQRTLDYSQINIDTLNKIYAVIDANAEIKEEFTVDNLTKEDPFPWHEVDFTLEPEPQGLT